MRVDFLAGTLLGSTGFAAAIMAGVKAVLQVFTFFLVACMNIRGEIYCMMGVYACLLKAARDRLSVTYINQPHGSEVLR